MIAIAADREALDAEFSLSVLAANKGLKPLHIVQAWHRVWGNERIEKKSDGGDSAGDHGIPEIGQQEESFYRTLTNGQREAYDDLRRLVNDLWEKNKGWDGVDPWQIGEPVDAWKRRAIQDLALHPMRAFMLGQMLATEALDGVTHRPLLPTDKQAIQFLEHYTFSELDDAFEGLKGAIRTRLIDGMQQGAWPHDVARDIARTLDDYRTDWATIAITETTRAESQGRLREVKDQGMDEVRGSSAHDSRTCSECLDLLSDKVYDVDRVMGASNYGRRRENWVPCIPLHPRCRCVWAPVWKDTKQAA